MTGDTLPGESGPDTAVGATRRLRQAARVILEERGSAKGGTPTIVKDTLLVLNWAAWYGLALYLGPTHIVVASLLAVPLALSLLAVMFGVMHDGSHRSISHHGFWNRLGSLTLVVMGASAISWRQEHVVRHHGRTNALHEDPDLETGGWLRFHPGQAWRAIHRAQRYYAPFLYAFVAFRWVWFEDLDDLLHNRYGMSGAARWLHALEIAVAKAFHLSLFVVLPAWVLGPAPAAALYFLQMGVVGVVMSLTFVVAHVGEPQAMFDAVADGPDDWSRSQLTSTANFAVGNRLLGFFLGGLNFQIEHHLFPGTSPRHYPSLLPIVKDWARQEGLPYHEFPTVRAALAAHFRHLAALGARPSAAASA